MGNIFKETRELELIKVVKEEDTQPAMAVQIAKSRLYMSHKNLIVTIARKLVREGIELDDLIQEGTRGLWIGIKKYDLNSGFKLATYAYLWIKNAMERKLDKYGFIIRTPYSVKEDIKKVKEAIQVFQHDYGFKPTNEQIAQMLGWKKEKVRKTKRYSKGVVSYDGAINNDGNRVTAFVDMVKDEKDNPHEALVKQEKDVELHNIYKRILSDKQYKVLAAQQGFDGQETKSIKEIAKKCEISVPRVKQILAEAKDAIKNSEEIKDFLLRYQN